MRLFLFLLLWGGLTSQCLEAQAQVPKYSLVYPEFISDELDQIVYRTAKTSLQAPEIYSVDKKDWSTGDVFQFRVDSELTSGELHALAFQQNGKVVHLAKLEIIDNQPLTLPSLHNGFVVDSAQNWCIGLVYDPLGDWSSDKLVAKYTNEKKLSTIGTAVDDSKSNQRAISITYFNFTKLSKEEKGETKLSVLCIGTKRPDLQFSEKDARDAAEGFEQWGKKLYDDVSITLITGEETSKQGILKALNDFAVKVSTTHQDGDRTIVYFSGSGFVKESEKKLHLMASDYDYAHPNDATVTYSDFYRALSSSIGEKVIFIDAGIGVKLEGTSATKIIPLGSPRLLPVEDYTFYPVLSNQPEENSYENEEWGNGAMTEALLQFLSKEPITEGRATMFSEMLFRLTVDTNKFTRSVIGKQQHPMFSGNCFLDFEW